MLFVVGHHFFFPSLIQITQWRQNEESQNFHLFLIS